MVERIELTCLNKSCVGTAYEKFSQSVSYVEFDVRVPEPRRNDPPKDYTKATVYSTLSRYSSHPHATAQQHHPAVRCEWHGYAAHSTSGDDACAGDCDSARDSRQACRCLSDQPGAEYLGGALAWRLARDGQTRAVGERQAGERSRCLDCAPVRRSSRPRRSTDSRDRAGLPLTGACGPLCGDLKSGASTQLWPAHLSRARWTWPSPSAIVPSTAPAGLKRAGCHRLSSANCDKFRRSRATTHGTARITPSGENSHTGRDLASHQPQT